MNKNWLYRVLAMALVAMLALPVFAMAEEAGLDVLPQSEEAAVAEEAFDLVAEGDEDVSVVSKDIEANLFDYAMTIWTWDEAKWDANDEAFGGDAYVTDLGFGIRVTAPYDSISFKSSNKKVARVTKAKGYGGLVTFQGSGEATITVKAKYKLPNHKHKTEFKTEVKIKVKNPGGIDEIKGYYGDPIDALGGEEVDEDDMGTSYEKDMADGFSDLDEDEGVQYPTKVVLPVAYNDEDDLLDYQTGASIDTPAYLGGYSWEVSNADVLFFLPEEDEDTGAANDVWKLHQTKGYWGIDWDLVAEDLGSEDDPDGTLAFAELVADAMLEGEWDDVVGYFMPTLKPVLYKPGKSTVTFTATGTKKKVKIKFTVPKKSNTWTIPKDEAKKVGDNAVLAVKSITQKSIDEVDVTFAFINGTDATYKKHTATIAIYMGIDNYLDDAPYVVGKHTMKVTAKPKKVTTFKVTFKTSNRSAASWVPEEETDLEVVDPSTNLKTHNPIVVITGDPWLPSNHADAPVVKGFTAE